MANRRVLQAWDVSPETFPQGASMAARLAFVVRYAVLAPSVHNSQPWLFRIDQDNIELRVDRSRSMPVADPDYRELIMSCGSALMNLRLALRRFGFGVMMDILPDPAEPTLLARLTVSPLPEMGSQKAELFEAIVQRRTNRQSFRDAEVDGELGVELMSAARAEGAWLAVLSEETRSEVISVIEDADLQHFHDRRYRQELSSWLISNWSRRCEGVPGYSYGVKSRLASLALPVAVRAFDLGRILALRDRRLARSAGFLAVLGTPGDSVEHWLASGQALEAVALTAQTAGLATAFLWHAFELSAHRRRIRQLIGAHRGHPQLVLAIGRAAELEATPRRPLEDVLEAAAPHAH